jgi:N utilization substance protein A
MNKDLIAIFEYLEREKGIKREFVIQAIEDSLRLAAKKSMKGSDNVAVKIDPKSGDIEVNVQKEIVESVADESLEISIEDAERLAPGCKIGQRLEISIPPGDFGRIAAQSARQIITQKLKVAERDIIHEEYRHRVGEVISGTIKRVIRGRTFIVDLGKVEGILPERFMPRTEKYHVGERIQAYLLEVRDTDQGGAEVILSRSHPEFIVALFKQEVPEIEDGTVIVEKAVREAGFRTKLAVTSNDSKIDPVGTCVGVRGSRIKNIIREINNEKIDVIPFSENTIQMLQNATSPVEIKRIVTNENKLIIIVNDEDYPIILGKKGINARLIAKLIEKEIEVQKISDFSKLTVVQLAELADSDDPSFDEELKIEGLSSLLIQGLLSAGYETLRKVMQAQPTELMQKVPGINYLDLAEKILDQIKKNKG